MPEPELTDLWFEWITRGRDADDAELRRRSFELLVPIRDAVLDGAELKPGDTVLDVGSGDGFMGLGALQRMGRHGHVVFSDTSASLLDSARAAVAELGVAAHASFVVTPAQTLDDIKDSSIDAVVLRSVLIYIHDRPSAFRSFARVLKTGGRLSLFEPINAFFLEDHASPASFFGFDVAEVAGMAQAVKQVYGQRQSTDDPMLTLDLRELVALTERSGFDGVVAKQLVTSSQLPPGDTAEVTRLLDGKPNPMVPTVREAARLALSPTEADVFLDALRRAVEAGKGRQRQASVFLHATRWADPDDA